MEGGQNRIEGGWKVGGLATGILTPILIHTLLLLCLVQELAICVGTHQPGILGTAFVQSHQTMCEIFFLLLSQQIFPRGGPIGGQHYASI